MPQIEKEIFELETSYLEDTQQNGNILKGWDGYFQNMAQQRGNARQMKIKNHDRVFSQSSLSAPKVLCCLLHSASTSHQRT
eukprot:750780-Hanusia_phi.AAC.1